MKHMRILETMTASLLSGNTESDVLLEAKNLNTVGYADDFLARFIGFVIRRPDDDGPQNTDLRNDEITKLLWCLRQHNSTHSCEHVDTVKYLIMETMVRSLNASHGNRPQTSVWIDADPIYMAGVEVLKGLPYDPTRARELIVSRLEEQIFTTQHLHVARWCLLFKKLIDGGNHVFVDPNDPADVADAWRLLESWILSELSLEKKL